MAEPKLNFTSNGVPVKSDDYHGSCQYVRTSPNVAANGVKSVNIEMTFEDAMRLSVAIQSAVIRLNRYNRTSIKGKRMGLCLSLKTEAKSITVIEASIKPLMISQSKFP